MSSKTNKASGFNIANFSGDPDKESNGVWVEIAEGFAIKVAKLNNPKYERYVSEHGFAKTRQSRLMADVDKMDLLREVTIKAAARFVLLDWRNLLEPVNADDPDGDTAEVKYSIENAERLMRESRGFYDLVIETANDSALFKRERTAADAGN